MIDEETRQRIQVRLGPLVAMFPNFHPTIETFEAYVMVLADIDSAVLETAVLHLLEQPLDFMPTAGRIREVAFDLADNAGGSGIPDAYAAWEEVLSAIREYGSYRTPIFSNELIERAVRHVGGWRELCASENTVADRARFLEAFSRLRSRHREDSRMMPVVRDQMKLLAGKLSAQRMIEKPKDE